MVPIELKIKTGPAINMFVGFSKRLKDLRPVMRGPINDSVVRMLKENMLGKGKYATPAWAPLKKSTILRKPPSKRDQPMRRTDALFRALSNKRSTNNKTEVKARSFKFWLTDRVGYSKFHQLGTGRLPIRQVIPDPVPATFVEELVHYVRLYIYTGSTTGSTNWGSR